MPCHTSHTGPQDPHGVVRGRGHRDAAGKGVHSDDGRGKGVGVVCVGKGRGGPYVCSSSTAHITVVMIPNQPTDRPTNKPTNQPTNQRTNQPTDQPTDQPTNQPTTMSLHTPGVQDDGHGGEVLRGLSTALRLGAPRGPHPAGRRQRRAGARVCIVRLVM